MQQLHTCFVPSALTPGSEVEGLPHSELRLMQVILVHIRCCVHCPKLVKAPSIVGDTPGGGDTAAVVESACQGVQEGGLASPRGAQQEGESARVQNAVHGVQDGEALGGELFEMELVEYPLEHRQVTLGKITRHAWPVYACNNQKQRCCSMGIKGSVGSKAVVLQHWQWQDWAVATVVAWQWQQWLDGGGSAMAVAGWEQWQDQQWQE